MNEARAKATWTAAFAHREFVLFQPARSLGELQAQMQNVAIGWQVYAITGRALDLAWVGLAQFLPAALLSLVTGHVADRASRLRLSIVCQAALAGLSAALFLIARLGGNGPSTLPAIYVALVGVGVARADRLEKQPI